MGEAIAANDGGRTRSSCRTEAPAPQVASSKLPQAQTAKTPERKEAEKPTKQAAAKPKSEEKEFDADEVAALLNKEKASGGGAKRSTETAFARRRQDDATARKLSQSEMDALRGQVQRCWNIPAGAADAGDLTRLGQVQARSPGGWLEGAPEIINGGGSGRRRRAAAEAARRAVSRCAPYDSARRKIRGLGGRYRQFRPKRNVLK